jgi:hypothetical protein
MMIQADTMEEFHDALTSHIAAGWRVTAEGRNSDGTYWATLSR